MRKDEAVARLVAHRDEMVARFGVRHLALFGSTVRDEATSASDVDVLVEFDKPASFDAYYGLLHYLEDLLGCQVDLVTEKSLHPRMRPQVDREAVHVA